MPCSLLRQTIALDLSFCSSELHHYNCLDGSCLHGIKTKKRGKKDLLHVNEGQLEVIWKTVAMYTISTVGIQRKQANRKKERMSDWCNFSTAVCLWQGF